MTVVSSKEFATRPTKYYNLAVNELVAIKRGKNMFHLTCTNGHNTNEYEQVFQPDDDFYRSISMDEFLERVKKNVHQFYESKRNESSNIAGS